MSQQSQVPLHDAVADYLSSGGAKNREAAQRELSRFLRWFGRDRRTGSLAPTDVEGDCATLGRTGESTERLAITKQFLSHLHKQEATSDNLASHAKLPRGGRGSASLKKGRAPEAALQVTQERYQQMEVQLVEFKKDRLRVTQEIRRAAADKDISENAPLDAAREQQGHLEARIRDLEEMLQRATILGSKQKKGSKPSKIALGTRVVLRHTVTGKQIQYLLVDSSEADPSKGKLSVVSPVGKAILNHRVDDTVEVATPGGSVSYIVKRLG